MGANVILVGFMGAGKSSVGRLLARRLGRCFVETDDMITARKGRSILEIFAERGEAHFRSPEEETVRLLALKSGDVIATGGGLFCREGRPEALKALGTVVWLRGDFEQAGFLFDPGDVGAAVRVGKVVHRFRAGDPEQLLEALRVFEARRKRKSNSVGCDAQFNQNVLLETNELDACQVLYTPTAEEFCVFH